MTIALILKYRIVEKITEILGNHKDLYPATNTMDTVAAIFS